MGEQLYMVGCKTSQSSIWYFGNYKKIIFLFLAYTKIIGQLGDHYRAHFVRPIMISQLTYNFCICQKKEYNFFIVPKVPDTTLRGVTSYHNTIALPFLKVRSFSLLYILVKKRAERAIYASKIVSHPTVQLIFFSFL